MTLQTAINPASEQTRNDLIAAGIAMFGELGYDGASVRALTRLAGVNIAAVKYHFGSKEEFFDACVDHVSETLAVAGPRKFLPKDISAAERLSRSDAGHALRAVVRSVIESAFDPERAEFVRFMHSQVMIEGRGQERFIKTTLQQHHQIFSALVARAEDLAPDADTTRTRALAIMIQTISLVRSQKVLTDLLGWASPQEQIDNLVDAIYPTSNFILQDH